ncbi:MAG: hydroxyacylglutathione hydrolase [Gammaproteobacteria bacterium]
MIIERIWPGNAWRNYHYLIGCGETGEAMAVDPLDWRAVHEAAQRRGWTINHILNTHEHGDHIGGNDGLRAANGAEVLAHAGAAPKLSALDRAVGEGDIIRIGRSVELECLDTPGHTRAHVCLLAHGDRPALISGDTLFNAGAGNCHNGGDPDLLYETFETRFARLPDAVAVHPGHDYLARNLAFTLEVEPDNAAAAALLAQLTGHGAAAPITTLGEERRINAFFRLQRPTIVDRLRQRFPELPAVPTPRQVFLKLRELRNAW